MIEYSTETENTIVVRVQNSSKCVDHVPWWSRGCLGAATAQHQEGASHHTMQAWGKTQIQILNFGFCWMPFSFALSQSQKITLKLCKPGIICTQVLPISFEVSLFPGCSLILLRCYLPGETLGTRLPEGVPLQIHLFCTTLLRLLPSYSCILYNYFFQCVVCLSH